MPLVQKKIVSSAVYNVGTVENPEYNPVYPERIKHWAKTFEDMQKAGLLVTSPWHHGVVEGGKTRYTPKLQKELLPEDIDASNNAGFWQRMWTEEEDGIISLWGEIEAPGDPADPNTPAGKLGTTVKETSIWADTFRDGTGKVWYDAPLHIAACVHGREPGQENFQHVPAISMSQMSATIDARGEVKDLQRGPDFAVTGGMNRLRDLLKKAAKLALPDDTTEQNLMERLLSALLQKDLENQEDNDLKTPPRGGKIQSTSPGGIIMTLNSKQIEALVSAGVVNPVTGQPFGPADFKADVTEDPRYKELENKANAATAVLLDSERKSRKARIDALVASGTITKEYADKHFVPMLAGIAMSLTAEGTPAPQPLDVILLPLEEAARARRASFMGVSGIAMSLNPEEQVEPVPDSLRGNRPVDQKRADEIVATIMANTGSPRLARK